MKIEDVKNLLEEIEPDEDGYGYIDCGTATEYMDCNRYKKIIAALKQNVELQQAYIELTKKLEEVEKHKTELLLTIEKLKKSEKEQADNIFFLANEFSKLKKDLKIDNEIRLGNYIFKDGKYYYDPVKKPEPIELKIKITENSDNETKCPICGNSLGKYPAISRADNKTEICSNCGTLEALKAFKESLKDDKNGQ